MSGRAITGLAVLSIAIAGHAGDVAAPDTRILDLMVDVVTPAANALRAAEKPISDESWRELEYAARVLERAFDTIKAGGTGPNDMQWAAEATWDADSDAVIAIAQSALMAVKQQDADAMLRAASKLYGPCEACHVAYLPGIDPESSTD